VYLALGLVAAALIVGALVLAGARWRRADLLARLPSPPAVAGQTRAVASHLRDRYEEARRDPSAGPVGTLCLAYHADMFFDHASRCYEVAADLDGDDWRWSYYRALILAERGGGGALVELLRSVTRAAPRFAPAWLRLGDAEFKAGRYDAAADAWVVAARLEEPARGTASPSPVVEIPLAGHASLGLARVALVRGDANRARELLEDLTTKVPGFGPAHRLLADSYRRSGREVDAGREVYRANRRPPYTPYADPMVDDLARESRHSILLLRLASEVDLSINGAWSEYLTRRAAEFDPGNPDVVVKLGRILRTLERNDEALEYFEQYHRMVPGDYQGLAHIGGTLSALGRFGEAESYFRRAVAGIDDPVTHYNLGLLLVVTGRESEGIREYERALEGDPMHADARSNLAAVLARRGQVDRASRELAFLVEHDPENAIARTNLGLVLMQQGRDREAEVQLEEAVRLAPTLAPAAEALALLGGR
jgi:tetratricopeptide (TPR) repeat protein